MLSCERSLGVISITGRIAEIFVQLEVGILIKTAESSSHFGARLVDHRLYTSFVSNSVSLGIRCID